MLGISDFASLLDKLATQNFLINPNRCISVRNRNVECGKCLDACVSGCIRVDGRALLVDTSRCIGCGTCATACPTEAIQTINPSRDELENNISDVMRKNAGTVAISCSVMTQRAESLVDPESVVRVACLGRIDESLIVQAAAQGAKCVALVSDDCATCDYIAGAKTIQAVCQSASALLSAWESPGETPCKIRLSRKFPKICAKESDPEYDFRRRDFLLSMRDTAKTSGQQTAVFLAQKATGAQEEDGPKYEHVTEDGALAHIAPKKREILIQALSDLGKASDRVVSGRLWRRVHIDKSRCSGCQMCATFCPSGAIRKHVEVDEHANAPAKLYRAPGNPKAATSSNANAETGAGVAGAGTAPKAKYRAGLASDKISLVCTPRLCLNCESCARLCPKGAITLSADVQASEIASGCSTVTPLKNIFSEKGGPDAIRNSMSKLIDSKYLWG